MSKLRLVEDAYAGKAKRIVWYVDKGGTANGKEFYDTLSTADQVKFEAPFRYLGDHGRITNKEKWRHEGDGIWALKIFKQRLAAFIDGDIVVITHGYIKKRDAIPPGELQRARRLRDEYMERKKG